MPDKTDVNKKWLNSNEARKKLKVSACNLSHLREAGKLEFKKEGNAYFYSKIDIRTQLNGEDAKR
jgi:ribosomal protein L28